MLSKRKFTYFSSFVIALLSGIMIMVTLSSSSILYSNDSYMYLAFSRSVLANGWSESFAAFPVMANVPPLLPLILIGSGKFGWNPVTVGLTINLLGIIFACQGVLFCSLRIYKSRFTGLIAAVLVCSLPKLYMEGCNIQRDSLFWMELTWLFYLLLRYVETEFENKKQWVQFYLYWIPCLSVLSSLACLTRKEGFPLFFLTLLSFIFLSYRKKNLPTLYAVFAGIVLFLLSVAITCLPLMRGVQFYPGSFLFHLS